MIISSIFLSNILVNEEPQRYSYTKAICDESNYCEDYYIECDGKKEIKISPTGFSIQQDKNWEDTREEKKEFCD